MMIINKQMLMVGGAALLIAAVWALNKGFGFSAKETARNIAEGATDAVVGAGLGVVGVVNDTLGIPRTDEVLDWLNSDSNPLSGVGEAIGGTIYDLTHW